MTRVPLTPKATDPADFEELPSAPGGVSYDPSDRKFLAVSAAHPEHPPILQALDSKWWGWREPLASAGIRVHVICPAEIAKKHAEKMGTEWTSSAFQKLRIWPGLDPVTHGATKS